MNVFAHRFVAIAAVASLARFVGVDSSSRAVYPPVGPGIEYTHRQIGDGPWVTFVVKIDRARGDLAWATSLARGTITGLSTVREQIEAFPRERGTPVVAVNGDFFIIRPGDRTRAIRLGCTSSTESWSARPSARASGSMQRASRTAIASRQTCTSGGRTEAGRHAR